MHHPFRWSLTALFAAPTLILGTAVHAQLPAACADRTLAEDSGVLTGTVLAAGTRMPLQKAGVEVSWRQDGRRTRPLEVETDSLGSYVVCSVPGDTQLRVQVLYLGARITEVAEVPAGGTASVDVSVEIEGEPVTGEVQVADTGEPLPGVVIRLAGTPAEAVSGEGGRFRFEALPAGTYNLVASHVGYPAIESRFAVNVGERVDLTLRMSERPIELDPIQVEVRQQRLEEVGFYDRRERGRGHYLSKAQIQAKQPLIPSDALRGIAGLTILPSNFGPYQEVTGRRGCPFRYYVNGARAGANFMIDELSKEWIEAIEVYRGLSSVPSEYVPAGGSENAACGVILVWLTNAAHDFRKR